MDVNVAPPDGFATGQTIAYFGAERETRAVFAVASREGVSERRTLDVSTPFALGFEVTNCYRSEIFCVNRHA